MGQIEDFLASSSSDDSSSPRRPVLLLRWLVIIATSYLVLFSGEIERPGLAGALLLAFIVSNLIVSKLPDSLFFGNATLIAIVLFDSTIVSMALLLSPAIESDIFILYFFVILLAAAGGSFTGIVVAALVVPGLYLFTIAITQGWEQVIQTRVLLRVPFIFCVCIFYGFLSERTRRERLRAELAELSENTKTQLFSMLTHDVRNALGTILGYSEILLDGPGRDLPEPARKALEQIKITSLHSAQLISNLLDTARIEGGRLQIVPQPIELAPLLAQIADRYVTQAALKRIRLEVDVPEGLPEIEGDDLHLDRVFANLLSNALKFTPEEGRVTIRARAVPEGLCVEIEDTGPGIPEEERERVFQIYGQSEIGRSAGGTGLGLFVVRTVLEAHKARIEIDRGAEGGALFRVTFRHAGGGVAGTQRSSARAG